MVKGLWSYLTTDSIMGEAVSQYTASLFSIGAKTLKSAITCLEVFVKFLQCGVLVAILS
jgi:hypothetical protein